MSGCPDSKNRMIGIKIPDVRSEAGQMFETTNYRVFVIENVGRPGQKVIDVRNDKLQGVRNIKCRKTGTKTDRCSKRQITGCS